MSDHDHRPRDPRFLHRPPNQFNHRQTQYRMQSFRQLRFHSGAFASGKDDSGDGLRHEGSRILAFMGFSAQGGVRKGRLSTLRAMTSRPDSRGRFGDYGGRYVPETLIPALDELEQEFDRAWADPAFRREFDGYLKDFVGRPTPLTEAL